MLVLSEGTENAWPFWPLTREGPARCKFLVEAVQWMPAGGVVHVL
jgi:hypothetical protein